MGLIFPPFLLFGILLGMGTATSHYRGSLFISLFQGRVLLSRVWEVNGTSRRRELSVYKQEPLIPMSEEAERLQYYMEELKLETEATNLNKVNEIFWEIKDEEKI